MGVGGIDGDADGGTVEGCVEIHDGVARFELAGGYEVLQAGAKLAGGNGFGDIGIGETVEGFIEIGRRGTALELADGVEVLPEGRDFVRGVGGGDVRTARYQVASKKGVGGAVLVLTDGGEWARRW